MNTPGTSHVTSVDRETKALRLMKGIVIFMASTWTLLTLALAGVIIFSESGTSSIAAAWTLICGTAASVGGWVTWLVRKWGVWLYLAGTIGMLGKQFFPVFDTVVDVDWGYLLLLGVYLIAVIPAWQYMLPRGTTDDIREVSR